MRFAESVWLLGLAVAGLVAVLLGIAAFRQARALDRFVGREQRAHLVTERPAVRRMLAAILLVSAVGLAFVAAAAPQYGHGTRLLPRTNLDVVLVLDYSKSMFARDVTPSRTERSKIEVGRLVQKLGGARFGAVAFAGEPMAFPLTSDGSAIAQFFQGLTPHDMPVGGTATARALEAGRQLLLRDPLSKNHEKVLVLITDGEDLEGDPKAAAEAAHADGITVNVVQIGGRSPEPIPDVDEHGRVSGFRKDEKGAPLTTYLTPEGEKQLEEVASVGGGQLVRAGAGDTGIDQMADSLRKLMAEELSERVETVFVDVFQYPLGLAVFLLLLEAGVKLGRVRRPRIDPPMTARPKRKPRRLVASAAALFFLSGCAPYDQLFERDSPQVEEARAALKAGDGKKAVEILTQYLELGQCEEGVIGFGARAKSYPNASFDLGLAFGADNKPAAPGLPPASPGQPGPGPASPTQPGTTQPGPNATPPIAGLGLPGQSSPALPGVGLPGGAPAAAPKPELDCALRLLAPLADSESESAALRARALYVMGQVEMKRENFEAAADAYTRGLRFVPAEPEGQGDAIGRDLAFNRAVALSRALEKEKQEQEKKKEPEKDKQDQKPEDNDEQKDPEDKSDDSSKQDQDDKQEQQKPEDKPDDSDSKKDEQKGDEQADSQKPEDTPKPDSAPHQEQPKEDPTSPPNEPGAPAQAGRQAPQVSQDDRILDQLEETPTLQEQAAKQNARGKRVRATEDK